MQNFLLDWIEYDFIIIIIIIIFKIGSYLTHSLKIQKNITSCMIGLLNFSIFFIKKKLLYIRERECK